MVVAFIHAKGISTRVKGKNLRILGDKPLFCHAIINSLNSELIDKVVIDSDSEEILDIGSKCGAVPLRRPKTLATNFTTGDDLAYWEASNYPNSDMTLQVVPTSPFIMPKTIDDAIKTLQINKHINSIVACRKDKLYTWHRNQPCYLSRGKIPNSNELLSIIYETTGLYVNRTQFVLKYKKRINIEKVLLFYISKLESIDINTEEDFRFAEIVWKGLNNK